MVYNFTQAFNITNYRDFAAGSVFGALLLAGILIALVLFIVIYVYQALAWYAIAKKMKHKHPWLAWIPFANAAMILQLGGFGWGWVFLFLIPILGWIAIIVLLTIATWRIFKKRGFPAWLSLSFPLMCIPKLGFLGLVVYMVSIGIVAWRKR